MSDSKALSQGQGANSSGAPGEKKPYERPRICGRELLETIAAACGNGGKETPTNCNTFNQS